MKVRQELGTSQSHMIPVSLQPFHEVHNIHLTHVSDPCDMLINFCFPVYSDNSSVIAVNGKRVFLLQDPLFIELVPN